METLLSHAEYAGVEVPRKEDVIEKRTRQGSVKASAGFSGAGLGGSLGKDVEVQSSYSLTPSQKAVVSKTIDELIRVEHAVQPERDTPLSKDQLVELDGVARLTTATMAGKLLHLLLRTLRGSEQGLADIDFDAMEPAFMALAKEVYLGNELLPIPMLLELSMTGLDIKVYLNLSPNHFVDMASVDRVEGEVRALGTISKLVKEGEFFSAEQWLLDGYEWLIRRLLMTDIDDMIEKVTEAFEIVFPADDVHAHIAGPAIVVDVVALY